MAIFTPARSACLIRRRLGSKVRPDRRRHFAVRVACFVVMVITLYCLRQLLPRLFVTGRWRSGPACLRIQDGIALHLGWVASRCARGAGSRCRCHDVNRETRQVAIANSAVDDRGLAGTAIGRCPSTGRRACCRTAQRFQAASPHRLEPAAAADVRRHASRCGGRGRACSRSPRTCSRAPARVFARLVTDAGIAVDALASHADRDPARLRPHRSSPRFRSGSLHRAVGAREAARSIRRSC